MSGDAIKPVDVLATVPGVPWQPKPRNWRQRYSYAPPSDDELGSLSPRDIERKAEEYRKWLAEKGRA